jgi:hypothetical protein
MVRGALGFVISRNAYTLQNLCSLSDFHFFALAPAMFATSDGYAVPVFLAKAFAAFFWLGLSAFGLPNPLGRGFS